jgi:hypothetical protein
MRSWLARVRESLTLAGRAERAPVFHAFVGLVSDSDTCAAGVSDQPRRRSGESMGDARVRRSIKACASV